MGEFPSASFVKPDDFAWEINQRIAPAVSGRDVHAVNRSHAPRLCESVKLANGESVMIKKLVAGDAVAHVAFIGRVLVKTREWRRVNRKVNAAIRKGFHYLDAIAVVDCVSVGNNLVLCVGFHGVDD
jgi:hypothetical protein